MRLLSGEEVAVRLARIDLLGVVGDALIAHAEGRARVPPQSHLAWETPSGGRARSLAMHAAIDGFRPVVGVKVINANPANVEQGRPRAAGLTLLFDPESAAVETAMPSEDISAARTAALSTLAVLHTRAQDDAAETLGIIGCGRIADWHVRLLTAHCRFRRLVVFDLVAERAQAFADRWGASMVGDAESVVSVAGVLITATTTTVPYLRRASLAPGATVVNVSLDDLHDDVLIECNRLFVDDWPAIVADQHRRLGHLARAGRVAGPGEPPPPTGRAVTGTVGDLLTGSATGRASPSELVVINPFGTALTDVALAAAVAGV